VLAAPLRRGQLEATIQVKELWKTRKRVFTNMRRDSGWRNELLNQSIQLVGATRRARFFLNEEARLLGGQERAALVQKFGRTSLGWAGQSRPSSTLRVFARTLVDVIEFLMKLGFEKAGTPYYAGSEAGLGRADCEAIHRGIVGLPTWT